MGETFRNRRGTRYPDWLMLPIPVLIAGGIWGWIVYMMATGQWASYVHEARPWRPAVHEGER